ncbi:hypothetical protein ES708_08884 [subsurface metagenome]
MKTYLWHKQPAILITKPVFKKGVKRNALILPLTGEPIVVPWRSLRRAK